MNGLRLLRRSTEWTHAEELRSLFVVSLPRSLSSLLYVAAARAIGLAEPAWTSDGEILNRDRVPRRLQCLAPADERFTLLGSAPDAFAGMTTYLDSTARRQGFAYKDVVQPFVIGGWEGLGDFEVLKVRRNVAEVAYTMLKRKWVYPARAASVFDVHPWALVEGLVRAEAVLDALPGETVEYADAVLDHDPLEAALRRLYPDAPVAPLRYIDHGFTRTRRRLEAERRDSLVFRRLEWIVSAVRERLRFDDPREEIAAEALP
ncbi:MAG: hypothetical protein E6G12_08290 [Actinobacteria bacterium]|nr:MAG: hypothetical protein E6G12_08290 [Actinomycetota bacterium]